MIQRNNNLSVLPFYEDDNEQLHNRSYAYGDIYPLYTPMGTVPPFQIIKEHYVGASVTSAVLKKSNGETVGSILSGLNSAGMLYIPFADYDIIAYPSSSPAGLTSAEGQYYIQLGTSDGKTYYSDIFTVVGQTGGFIAVQWWDIEDLQMDGGRIVYKNGVVEFRNTLWLQTQLGKPEYTFNEEGETRDGYFFPEKMVSEKTYKCTILASEDLCDIMRFIRLSDYVFVQDQYGNTYRCDTFLITPKWETQGNIASVEIEFTCYTVAKKIGRGSTGLADENINLNNN